MKHLVWFYPCQNRRSPLCILKQCSYQLLHFLHWEICSEGPLSARPSLLDLPQTRIKHEDQLTEAAPALDEPRDVVAKTYKNQRRDAQIVTSQLDSEIDERAKQGQDIGKGSYLH